MTLDLYTFGSTDAGVTLVKELGKLNSPKLYSKVFRCYNIFGFHLNQLEKTDHKTKCLCATILKHQFMESVTDHYDWAGNIRSLLKNVMASLYVAHTCWEVQQASNIHEQFGSCDMCMSKAIIRFKYKSQVIGRYCDNHKTCIDDLHKKMRTSGAK